MTQSGNHTHGYCRCSTDDKKQDISRQVDELKEMGADFIYKEYASGIRNDRKEYNKMLAAVRPGDTIIALETSRLTRSVTQFAELLEFVQSNHLCLVIKNGLTVDCRDAAIDPTAKAMCYMSAVFAELERSLISERVKSGMAAARRKGKLIGRERVTAKNIPSDKVRCVKKWLPDWIEGTLSKTDYAKYCNISIPTLNKYLNLLSDAGKIDLCGKKV